MVRHRLRHPLRLAALRTVHARLDLRFPIPDLPDPNRFQMTDPRLIDEIGARLSEVLAASPARDVEKNVRALLASFFDRFDLVTRDDFEAQKRVLERAHSRIGELEKRLGELELGQTQRTAST